MFSDTKNACLTRIINPAVGASFPHHAIRRARLLREGLLGYPVEQVKIPTNDGAILDSMFFGKPDAKKMVIFCPGSVNCYESVGDASSGGRVTISFFLNNLEDTAVLFVNYRGVHKSTGKFCGPDTMEMDIRAAVDYVINSRNIAKNQIVVYGQSLGGLAALNDYGVNLFVDRSFDRISEVVNASFLHLNPESWMGRKTTKVLDDYHWNRSLAERVAELQNKVKITILNIDGDELMQPGIALLDKVGPSSNVHTVRLKHKVHSMKHHNRPFLDEEIALVQEEFKWLFGPNEQV